MREAITIHGPRYRARLQVFDFTDGAIEKWRNTPITFAVTVLDQRFPKNTSFGVAGDQKYYGPSIDVALDHVFRWTSNKITLPVSWRKYISKFPARPSSPQESA